jgi:hypothetical protein
MHQAFKATLLALAVIASVSCFAISVQALKSTSTPSASTSPGLTAEQKAYRKTIANKCLKRYYDEKIPRSEHRTFLVDCFRENGITNAVRVQKSSAPASPAPPGKSSK